MSAPQTVETDLIVVGAGYAGVNAVYAAMQHLPKGARIAWIDTRKRIGGQWVDQYDYVRLHQPYESFTIGGHSWKRNWHWTHLATKPQILEYFEEAISEGQKASGVEIVRVFGYEYSDYTSFETEDGKKVEARAIPLDKTQPEMLVRGERMIKAMGFKVPVKSPAVFSAAERVTSTCPVELLDSNMIKQIQASAKPIYVLGSGKTSLDTMNMLTERLGVGSRLHCISGNGTLFINRDRVFPQRFVPRNMYGGKTFLDWFRSMGKDFDGNNTLEVLRKYEDRGLLHSPIPGSTTFVCGLASKKEVESVKQALSPIEEKVIKGHLIDIVSSETPEKAVLRIRQLNGKVVQHEIPNGSFFVNCTDHLSDATSKWEPVMSEDGLVLAPQWLIGFSGPSASYCTHMWFLDEAKLDDQARNFPRLEFDLGKKANLGIGLALTAFLVAPATTSSMPGKYALQMNPRSRIVPLHRILPAIVRLKMNARTLLKHMQEVMPQRFTDECPEVVEHPPVIGGNLGVTMSSKY